MKVISSDEWKPIFFYRKLFTRQNLKHDCGFFVKQYLFDNMLNVSTQKCCHHTLHKFIYLFHTKSQDGHLLSTRYFLQYNLDVTVLLTIGD